MTESNEQVKVSPRDIPLVADTIKEGFIEDGWQDAGTYPVKGGMAMGFLDSDRKFLAVVSLLKDGKGVSCSYKVDKFNPENVESEDKDGNPILAIGGIAAIAASAIAFPMATLGAAIIGLGAALFSGSTEDEVTAKAIAIIRRQLTDIEEAVFAKRKIPKSRKYDIFISYRHDKGREFGRKLYEVYKKKGMKVFFYQFASSKIQRTINEATCNAVRNSKHVLVILTPGFFDKCTAKDDGCRVEIETALEEGKSIVPIRLDGYSGKEIPAGLPERLADFTQWQGINISDLAPDVSVIKAIAERMRLNLRNSGRREKKGAKKMKSSVWCKLLVLIMFCIMSEGSFADKTYGYVAQGGIYYHTECEFTRVGDAVSIQWSRAYVGDCLNKDSESASVSSTIEWSFNLLRTTEGSFPVYVTSRVVGIGPSAVSSSRAFFECTKLKRVTLPDTLSYIGPNSFWRCSELQTIEIPGSVTNIGSGAFSECAALKSIGMPDSMTTISASAFYECDSLKDVNIGKNVETIGSAAFCRCYAMTEITIPASVTNIAFDAFKGCAGLQRFIVDPANPNYASYDGALYTKDLKTLVCYPGGRTDVKLPSVAVETKEDAFTGCGKLWAEWYRAFQKTRYDLSNTVEDRAITSITVDRDTVLDDFVMTDGKVYDTVLHIVNTSNGAVNLTLPKGYTYETFKGSIPLAIPANSRNVLTITRTADDSFLVAREELEVVK